MIKKIENTKYFGGIEGQHLKWDVRENNLIIKTHKFKYFYVNTRKILDKQILRLVNFVMAQSILKYGITV